MAARSQSGLSADLLPDRGGSVIIRAAAVAAAALYRRETVRDSDLHSHWDGAGTRGPRDSAGGHGNGTQERDMGLGRGSETWEQNTGARHGNGTRDRDMGAERGRGTRFIGASRGRGTWERDTEVGWEQYVSGTWKGQTRSRPSGTPPPGQCHATKTEGGWTSAKYGLRLTGAVLVRSTQSFHGDGFDSAARTPRRHDSCLIGSRVSPRPP